MAERSTFGGPKSSFDQVMEIMHILLTMGFAICQMLLIGLLAYIYLDKILSTAKS